MSLLFLCCPHYCTGYLTLLLFLSFISSFYGSHLYSWFHHDAVFTPLLSSPLPVSDAVLPGYLFSPRCKGGVGGWAGGKRGWRRGRMEKGSEKGGQQQSPQGYEPTEGRRLEKKWGERGNRGGWGQLSVCHSVCACYDPTLFIHFLSFSVCFSAGCILSCTIHTFRMQYSHCVFAWIIDSFVFYQLLIVEVVREWNLSTGGPTCNHPQQPHTRTHTCTHAHTHSCLAANLCIVALTHRPHPSFLPS